MLPLPGAVLCSLVYVWALGEMWVGVAAGASASAGCRRFAPCLLGKILVLGTDCDSLCVHRCAFHTWIAMWNSVIWLETSQLPIVPDLKKGNGVFQPEFL